MLDDSQMTIWDEGVYGIFTHDGYVDYCQGVRRIDSNSYVTLVGTGKELAEGEEFLVKHGFHIDKIFDLGGGAQEDLVLSGENNVLIVCRKRYTKRLRELCSNQNVQIVSIQEMELFYDYMRPQLKEAYNLLDDERSREVYTASLTAHINIKPYRSMRAYCEREQYFAIPEMCDTTDSLERSDDVFVDCGAFVGDTFEHYISVMGGGIGEIYAFEPGTREYNAMVRRRERLIAEWGLEEDQIVLVKAGVGEVELSGAVIANEATASGYPSGNQLTTVSTKGEIKESGIDVRSLDNYFQKKKVTFIKCDIEGSEMSMLRGAKNIISRDKPKMAICLYHRLTDYYEIPLFLKQLVPEYKMKVRHHSTGFTETVLYCWTED